MNAQPSCAASRAGSFGFIFLNCVVVAGLLQWLLPRKLLPTEYAEKRVVVVCIVLGVLLSASGMMQTQFLFLQSVLPASTLLVLYGRKLSQRGATADMWVLSLIYPVLPALGVSVVVCPWLARRLRSKIESANDEVTRMGEPHR